MRRFLIGLSILMSVTVAASAGEHDSSHGRLVVDRVAGPFDHPWGMAFLPDGAVLITERPGTLRLVEKGRISDPLPGVPRVRAWGQGGLLDVGVDPDFTATNRIYLTYAEPVGSDKARTALASLELQRGAAPRLRNGTVLFRQDPALGGTRHFGSRIVFADDGTLFITTGDRGDSDLVQALDNHIGKVIRIRKDGTVPDDNPFRQQIGAKPEIWSLGHRNPQGATKRPSDGAIITVSHGARGGDEVNRSESGKNYGWPEISYGTYYSGFPFSASVQEGMEQPLHYWDPSIAPSGAAFYQGDLFPQWRGHLLVGALKYQLISRLEPTADGGYREAERLVEDDYGRIRDVRIGPNGAIWFLTDEDDGGLYRITPAQ